MLLVVEPLRHHEDPRGELLKAHPGPVQGEVYALVARPGARRGDHWHDTMGEWFVAVSGRGVLHAEHPGSGERQTVDLAGVRVYVPAGVAHVLIGSGPEDLVVVAMAERLHDPDDVHPHRVAT